MKRSQYVMSCMKQIETYKKIDVDDIYACKVAVDMINEKEEHETNSIEKCTQTNDWLNQKEEIDKYINSYEREKYLDQ